MRAGRLLRLVSRGALAVGLFLLTVRLLGEAAGRLGPALEEGLPAVVTSGSAALGAAWTATHLVLNGSVVAAVAMSLGASGLLSPTGVFLAVGGSRLGSASFVVVVAALDHLRRRRRGVRARRSLEPGIVVLLLTAAIYLPAIALGRVSLPLGLDPLAGVLAATRPLSIPSGPLEWIVARVVSVLGPAGSFLLALTLLYLSLRVFDRVFESVDPDRLRERYLSRWRSRWILFAVGLVVTLVTTSVSFSIGVAVLPYNRGRITRRQLVPYVLGANVGTLADTLLVALVLDYPAGGAVTTILALAAGVLSLGAILRFERFLAATETALAAVTSSRPAFLGFAAALLLGPVVLVLLG